MENSNSKKIYLGDYAETGIGVEPVSININEIGKDNYSAVALGATGSGKTYAFSKMMIEGSKKGLTYCVLDIHDTMGANMIPLELRSEFEGHANRFDAYVNSIPCHLMQPIDYPDGVKERVFDTASFQTDVLSSIFRFGVKQEPTCRKAIKTVIANGEYVKYGYKAVGRALDSINSEVAMNVKEKIESLLDHNSFVDGDLPLEEGKINIFDLSKYDTHSQIIIAELLLHYIWRRRIVGQMPELFICIDEFQNIGMRKNGILSTILAEGRRFGLSTLLLTQSLKIHFNDAQIKLLMQSTYKFFFRSSEADLKELATLIDPHAVTDTILTLHDLKRGEFILCGPKYLGDNLETNPIKVIPGKATHDEIISEEEVPSNTPGNISDVKSPVKKRIPLVLPKPEKANAGPN